MPGCVARTNASEASGAGGFHYRFPKKSGADVWENVRDADLDDPS